MSKITPFLWFNDQLEEAMDFYTGLFPDGRILKIVRHGKNGMGPEGSAFTAEFELAGQRFSGINGGPHFNFNEAVSFVIDCADQAEVDRYWEALTGNGGAESQCGWCKDRFGVSWQVVPRQLHATINGPDAEGAARATQAMLKMRKIDVASLERAYAGV
ncbi:VOC family protein [Arsenicitalea aurantiaca]|uniref:VOC family protein n=1 Tax=Arsenicitalea aurantiaca TaxID=1783274 RepID=A0A433XM10_9HYPH|nr:VOC family protein [Arsenicitalea aurantiaca]RUT35127.1 VOC family protein [Arsenicitalea aurantiaca]